MGDEGKYEKSYCTKSLVVEKQAWKSSSSGFSFLHIGATICTKRCIYDQVEVGPVRCTIVRREINCNSVRINSRFINGSM